MPKVWYTVAVIYKGYDSDMDARIKRALRGSGVTCDGGGYFFPTGERDLVFFSSGNLPQAKISNIRRILRNIRRWKHVKAAEISRDTDY